MPGESEGPGQAIQGPPNRWTRKKRAAASTSERDARGLQLTLEEHELGVRTSQDGEARPGRARASGPSQCSDNAQRLIGVGLVGDDRSCRDRPAAGTRAPRSVRGCGTRRTRLLVDRRPGAEGRFSLSGPMTRPLDHDVGRAVVDREPNDLRTGIPLRKVDEGSGITPVPRIDRLVGVADDAEVVVVAEPSIEQPHLCRVHVLVLVNEEVAEPPPGRSCELGRRSRARSRSASRRSSKSSTPRRCFSRS